MKKLFTVITIIAVMCVSALGCGNRGVRNSIGQATTESSAITDVEYETEKFEQIYMVNEPGAYRFIDMEEAYQYKFFVPYGNKNGTYRGMSLVLSNKPNVTAKEVEQYGLSSSLEQIKAMGFVEVCTYFMYVDCSVNEKGQYEYKGKTYKYIYQFHEEGDPIHIVLTNNKDITYKDIKDANGTTTDGSVVFVDTP